MGVRRRRYQFRVCLNCLLHECLDVATFRSLATGSVELGLMGVVGIQRLSIGSSMR